MINGEWLIERRTAGFLIFLTFSYCSSPPEHTAEGFEYLRRFTESPVKSYFDTVAGKTYVSSDSLYHFPEDTTAGNEIHRTKVLEIGDRISEKSRKGVKIGFMTGSSTFEGDCFAFQMNNFSFDVCIDPDQRITYMQTIDKNFITEEGVRIGMQLASVKNLTDKEIYSERGWGHVLPLPSGWNAAFFVMDNEVKDDKTVDWIFKRKQH